MKRKGLPLITLTIFLVLFYIMAFYPGYMSFDSAYHYQQLETGEWTTFQPVVILAFWQLTDVFVKGPGGLFVLFLLLYFSSLFLLARYLQGGWLRRVLVLLSALLPVNIMLFPHVWKDIGLLVFVMLAVAFLVMFLAKESKWLLWMSLLSLWVAVLFRFEAVLYLWPIVFFQVRAFSRLSHNEQSLLRKARYRWRDGTWVILFVLIGLLGNKALVEISGAKKITLWPTVALWDIARVSIREDKVLMPPYTVGVGMTVEDLHQATHDWTNTSLFSSTRAGVNNGLYTPYSKRQYRELFKLWVSLPFKYPVSYAKHRLRLASDLLRVVETPNKPQDLFWTNRVINYNERFPVNQSNLNQSVNQFLLTRKDDFYFKPWFYVLVAVTLLLSLWLSYRHRHQLSAQQQLAVHLIVSALLSIGVMLFLAPAAEQRYLIILFNVIPLSACLAWRINNGKAL